MPTRPNDLLPRVTRPAARAYLRARGHGASLAQPSIVALASARRDPGDRALLDLAAREPYFHGVRLAAATERTLPDAASPAERWGRALAHAHAAFALHLFGEAQRQRLDELWFLARDAEPALRAYRAVARALPAPRVPRARYLPISRGALTCPNAPAFLRRFAHGANEPARVGLVDIGWRGRTQDAIARLLTAVAFHGLYLAYWPDDQHDHAPPAEDRHGYLADARRGDWLESFLFRHFAVLECLCRAPHGRVTGYRDEHRPTLAPFTPDPAASAVRSAFARALPAYAASAAALALEGSCTAADLRAAALERLRRLLHHPARDEAELLRTLRPDPPGPAEPHTPFATLGGHPGPVLGRRGRLDADYWPPGAVRLLPLGAARNRFRERAEARRAGRPPATYL